MTIKNPFPGMNPFAEQRWRDAHTALITYLRDALQSPLPPDLVAGAEEEAVAIGTGNWEAAFRPEVQVREPWPPPGAGGAAVVEPALQTATEPIRVFVEEAIERWVEIHDETGRLITVLELPSPSNKLESADRTRYAEKRNGFINAGVNLVEIDLVRQGRSVFPGAIQRTLNRAGASYAVCVFRAGKPSEREVYPIRIRDRLPAIRIPLRDTDADLVVELQPLVDQCHERGRYHRLNYHEDLDPPLAPEEAGWVDQLLREHGLR